MQAIEKVQRRFKKRLAGLRTLLYSQRLEQLNLPSLKLRRLHIDLIWCYKIVFKLVDVGCDDFFFLSVPHQLLVNTQNIQTLQHMSS